MGKQEQEEKENIVDNTFSLNTPEGSVPINKRKDSLNGSQTPSSSFSSTPKSTNSSTSSSPEISSPKVDISVGSPISAVALQIGHLSMRRSSSFSTKEHPQSPSKNYGIGKGKPPTKPPKGSTHFSAPGAKKKLFDSKPISPTRSLSFSEGLGLEMNEVADSFTPSDHGGRRLRNEADCLISNIISRRSSVDLRAQDEAPIAKMRRTSVCENADRHCEMYPSEAPTLLPSFCLSSEPTVKRIKPETLVDLIDGRYNDQFDKYYIIDCRFKYEYEGGHIKGAINIDDIDTLYHTFFKEPQLAQKICIVFHCEFSSHRAPRMYKYTRHLDRRLNEDNYPRLFYPEIYLLHEGYKNFFNEQKLSCEPMAYIRMDDDRYETERKICEPTNQNQWKRAHLNRTRSCDGV